MSNIPILEYDPCPHEVLRPNHEQLGLTLPTKAVFAFLGDTVDRYTADHDACVAGQFVSITKHYPVYTLTHKGQSLCLVQAPAGASAAVQLMDWLIAYGVTDIIAVGSCGCLTALPENTFLVPVRALRDEGTSYHYLPPARYIVLDPNMVSAIGRTLRGRGLSCHEVSTWTTDGFYRETPQKVARRREEGCSVVEMECAALAACARFRGARFGQLLYTADSLTDTEYYDERGWGYDSMEAALFLALDIAAAL